MPRPTPPSSTANRLSWLAKLGLGLAVVAIVVAVVAVVLYRQVTALPDWAEDEIAQQEALDPQAPIAWEAEADPSEPPSADVAEVLDDAPRATSPEGGRSAVDQANDPPPRRMVLRGFHRRGKGAGKDAVRASKAVLENGALRAGVVLDLSRIERVPMSESDRGLYEGALNAFPPLRDKNVYVGIETKPVRKGGVLQLGRDAKLRVGKVRYDLGSAAKKLGMSEAGLRKALNQNMRKLGFKAP